MASPGSSSVLGSVGLRRDDERREHAAALQRRRAHGAAVEPSYEESRLLAAIDLGVANTAAALARQLGRHREAVGLELHRLLAAGHIERAGASARQGYRLTDSGRAVLARLPRTLREG